LPALRHARWFTGEGAATDLPPDIEWRTAEGHPPGVSDWEVSDGRLLATVITVGEDGSAPRERVFVLLHAGAHASTVRLPDGAWHTLLDSASGFVRSADAAPTTTDDACAPWAAPVRGEITVQPPTLRVLFQPLPTEPETAP
jgi:glycogen operon protein